jgi:hypothetical protein
MEFLLRSFARFDRFDAIVAKACLEGKKQISFSINEDEIEYFTTKVWDTTTFSVDIGQKREGCGCGDLRCGYAGLECKSPKTYFPISIEWK